MKFKSLLEKYHEKNVPFYFSTPKYEILSKNVVDKISFEKAADIPGIVSEKKKSLKGKLIVGAIPFDVNESGTLYITDSWEKSESAFEERANLSLTHKMNNFLVNKRYLPSEESFMEMVEKGVGYIKAGQLEKLVLSRGVEIEFQEKVNTFSILKQLYSKNPFGYTYAYKTENGSMLVGASPEMLISKRGGYVYSNPLAGSRPRGTTPNEDQYLAEELKNSEKDLFEHRIVVNDIVKKISTICKSVEFSQNPDLIHTSQLWHLSSVISGELTSPDATVLDAALTIHPTPAVCGVPQKEAYKKIRELEGDSRELFTGIIGWCDEYGDGDWAIAIRGAVIRDNMITIKAGAGIVEGSIPKSEMIETGVKFRTMLSGINLY